MGDSTSLEGTNVPSTKPYLVRALYDWCVDNGFTPYLAVFVDASVTVPMEFVKNDEIVLNIGPDACQKIQLDNDWISFAARFGGIPKEIFVPVSHVMAIYARENGQGMSFPVQIPSSQPNIELKTTGSSKEGSAGSKTTSPTTSNKSHLKLVK
jgi:stringent starvation protein B